jgi:hypothetical protein
MESTQAASTTGTTLPEVATNEQHQNSTNDFPQHDKSAAQIEQEKADKQVLGSRPEKLPLQACFKVTEITHTTRGVTILKLAASYDGNIPRKNQLMPGARPVGEINLEVPDSWADAGVQHGSTFYLTA